MKKVLKLAVVIVIVMCMIINTNIISFGEQKKAKIPDDAVKYNNHYYKIYRVEEIDEWEK